MNDRDQLGSLRFVLAWRAGGASDEPTPECLDDAVIAALADGTIAAEGRATALVHLAGCARCRGAVASLVRALADRELASMLPSRTSGGRLARIAVPLAAAAVLLVVAWPPRAPEGGTTHRAPTITAAADPAPLFPMGAVTRAGPLRWAAVAGADRYRVAVFDAAGRVLYEAQVTDTVATLPDSVTFVPGGTYLWKVEARTGFDRWTASTLVEFVIGRPSPR